MYFCIHMTLCWNYVAEWACAVVRYPFFPRPHLWIGTDCTNDVVRAFQTNFHFIYFFHRALVTPEGRTHVGTCQGRLLHRKGRWSNDDVVCLFTPRGSTNIDISVRQLGLETRHFLTSTGEPEPPHQLGLLLECTLSSHVLFHSPCPGQRTKKGVNTGHL